MLHWGWLKKKKKSQNLPPEAEPLAGMQGR